MARRTWGSILMLLSFMYSPAEARPRLFLRDTILGLAGKDTGDASLTKEIDLVGGEFALGVEEPLGSVTIGVLLGLEKNRLRINLSQAGTGGTGLTAHLVSNYETAKTGLKVRWQGQSLSFTFSAEAELPRRQAVFFDGVFLGLLDLTVFARENANMDCNVWGVAAVATLGGRITSWWELAAQASGRFLTAECSLQLSARGEATVKAFNVSTAMLGKQEMTLLMPFTGIGSRFKLIRELLFFSVEGEVSLFPLIQPFWRVQGVLEVHLPLSRAGWRWK